MAATDKQGYIYIQQYTYAKPVKTGDFSLYRGRYSGNAEGNCTGLEVERDGRGKAMRFTSLEAIEKYLNI